MVFLLLSSLICCLVYLNMALQIFKLKKYSTLTVIFIIGCMAMCIWSFFYGLTYIIKDDTQIMLFKISAIGWCYCPAILLNLSLIFINNRIYKNKLLVFCLYIPASILMFIRVFLINSDTTTAAEFINFFYIFDFLYNFLFSSACYIMLFISYIKADNIKKKKQTKMILLTGSVSYISTFIIQTIIAMYNLRNTPQIGHILNIAIFIGIYYSIINYNLFDMHPNIIINNLIGNMLGIVIIVSPSGKILKINHLVEKITGYTSNDLLGKSIDILMEYHDILINLHKYNTSSYIKTSLNTKTNEIIPVNISIFPIINKKIDELSTILLIGHDIRNIKKLEAEVEKHKKTEKKLKESEEKFKVMFYRHTSIMCTFDPDTLDILDANDAALKFYGYPSHQFKQMKISDIMSLGKDTILDTIKNICNNTLTEYKSKHILSDCSIRDVEIHATPIVLEDKKVVFSIVNDITEKNKKEEYIEFLAYHDALTGLPNRKLFYIKLNRLLCNAKSNNTVFAVLYIDFDGFKLINDSYGHQIGDFVLCTVSKSLKNFVKKDDIVARIGGDEFTILLNNIENYENAEAIVEKLLHIINKPIIKNDLKLFIDASIGISLYPFNGDDIDSLIQSADKKMYTVKNKKRMGIQNKD